MRYQIPPATQQASTVPVTFAFTERKHRSFGAGVEYSSSEGLGTTLYWEHRKFYGQGEKLRADLHVAEITQELAASFVKQYFFARQQNFKDEANIKNEDKKK